MSTYTVAPYAEAQYFDNNGNPAAGYQLFTYASGSTTKQNTYSTATGTANTNPIVLDSSGRAKIFLDPDLVYKFVLTTPTDTDPPTSPIWTIDTVYPVQLAETPNVDVTGLMGETIVTGASVYCADNLYNAGEAGITPELWYNTTSGYSYASSLPYLVGIALNGGDSADPITVRIAGRVTGLSGVAVGLPNYCRSAVGTYGAFENGYHRIVGWGDSATSLTLPQLPARRAVPDIFGSINTSGCLEDAETDLGTASIFLETGEYADVVDTVVVKAAGSLAANTNSKVLRLVFEGQKLTLFTSTTNTANNRWTANLIVTRVSGTTAYVMGYVTFDAATNAAPTIHHVFAAFGSLSFPTSGSTLKFTGQGSATNDITKMLCYWRKERRGTADVEG